MVYVMLYAENANIVGTYDSLEHASADLVQFVDKHPELVDEIGIRGYDGGRPVTGFMPAGKLVGDRLAQQHLA